MGSKKKWPNLEVIKLQDASRTEVEMLPPGARKTLAELLMDLRTLEPRSKNQVEIR